MVGDGNCLFRSLAHTLNISHEEVRRRTVAHIEDEWDAHFRHFMTEEEQASYRRDIRRNGVWGDELSISAFAMVYRRSVVVYDRTSLSVIQRYEGDDSLPPVRVVFSGCHYDALEEDEVLSVCEDVSRREVQTERAIGT